MHRRFLVVLALLSFVVTLGAAACSNQAEGERCDVNDDNGGNDDCSSGLICYSKTTLGGVAEADNTDICCPTDRTQATTAICALTPTPPGGDAAPPPEASTSDTGTIVSSTDASDASSDSSQDAPLDAPASSSLDAAADGG